MHDDTIILHINNLTLNTYGYLSRHISRMNWYHNGTEITSSTRVSVANNGISLTISNMIDSDAGKYEVKIGSIGRGSSTACDRNFLPVLEVVAMTAPVTFIVQQYHIPKYNPEDIIKTITLDRGDNNLVINNSIKISSSHIYGGNVNSELLKNGEHQSLNNGQYTQRQKAKFTNCKLAR